MIRLGSIAAVFACVFFASCGGAVRPPILETGAGHWTGWVSFSGEFLLFDSREAMLRRDITRCISGALPLSEQISAGTKYEGKRVSVTGSQVMWKIRNDDLSIINQGSPIENRCSNRTIIFAETMIAIE